MTTTSPDPRFVGMSDHDVAVAAADARMQDRAHGVFGGLSEPPDEYGRAAMAEQERRRAARGKKG